MTLLYDCGPVLGADYSYLKIEWFFPPNGAAVLVLMGLSCVAFCDGLVFCKGIGGL